MDDENYQKEVLSELGLLDYENVDKILNQEMMTPKRSKYYLREVINEANNKRNELKGSKTQVALKFKNGQIS